MGRPLLPFFLCLVPLAAGCAGSSDEAVLAFVPGEGTVDPARPEYHDFGRVPDGERVSHVFYLRNDSASSIAILDVVPGCGCTVPSLLYHDATGKAIEGRPVRPGSRPEGPVLEIPAHTTAELAVRIDSEHVRPKNSHRLYTTRITTDAEASAYLTAETHILVENAFQIVPATIDLGRIPVDGGGSLTARVSVLSGYDVHPTGSVTATDPFVAELREREERGLRFWELEVSLPPPVAFGPVGGTVTLETAHAEGTPYRPLALPVSAFGVTDIESQPARLVLVSDGDAGSASVELYSLLDAQRLTVRSASVSDADADRLRVDVAPLDPDARGRSLRWRITLTVVAALRQDVTRGAVHVELAGEDQPTAEIPYVVHRR